MKTVYLVRHAKSSWDNPGLSDSDRPLNKRGLNDAPFMAKMMRGKGVKPDVLISSPAKRALTTASFFQTEMGLSAQQLLVRDEIYEASSQEILALINKLPQEYRTVMLFGHNPTFTYVANKFSKKLIDNIPTCGVIRIDAKTEQWKDFSPDHASVTESYFPKEYLS